MLGSAVRSLRNSSPREASAANAKVSGRGRPVDPADTAGDPTRVRAAYSCTASSDGAKTWAKPVRVAGVASDETQRGAAKDPLQPWRLKHSAAVSEALPASFSCRYAALRSASPLPRVGLGRPGTPENLCPRPLPALFFGWAACARLRTRAACLDVSSVPGRARRVAVRRRLSRRGVPRSRARV